MGWQWLRKKTKVPGPTCSHRTGCYCDSAQKKVTNGYRVIQRCIISLMSLSFSNDSQLLAFISFSMLSTNWSLTARLASSSIDSNMYYCVYFVWDTCLLWLRGWSDREGHGIGGLRVLGIAAVIGIVSQDKRQR